MTRAIMGCVVAGLLTAATAGVLSITARAQNQPAAAEPGAPAGAGPLGAEARRLRAQGKLDEAITAAEKMLAIEREVLGAEHPEVAVSLEWLAQVYIEREDFAAARKARQEVLALRGKLHGMKPWQVTDARLALADVERLAALSPTSAGDLPKQTN